MHYGRRYQERKRRRRGRRYHHSGVGTFELNDKEYIALEPEDGTDDVYIYGYKQISDDEFEITEIESEEEFDAAAAEFDAIMAEE